MKRLLTSFAATVALVVGLATAPVFAQPKGGDKGGAAPKAAAANQCIAKTQDGDQCKRKAADGSKYCWQHDPNRKAKGKATKKSS